VEQGDIMINSASCLRNHLNFDYLLSNSSIQSVMPAPTSATCSCKY